MYNPEFRDRFSGRFFGRYRGYVTDVDDPKKLGRIKTKVPEVLGDDEELGWALPAPITGGAPNAGDLWLPQVGNFVWVEFESGSPEYPVWSPGPWAIRDGGSMVPKHSRGEKDLTDYSVRESGNAPPSQFEGSYSRVRTIQGDDGSFLEFDATSGAERVQLSHRSGSRIEFTSDGGVQEVGIAGVRKTVTGNYNLRTGSEEHLILGEKSLRVEGVADETFLQNVSRQYNSLSESGRAFSSSWEGNYSTSCAGEYSVSGAGNGSMSFTGQLAVLAGSNVVFSALESVDISASAATTGEVPRGPLALPAMTLHGYNGLVTLKATDATGTIKTCSLEHNPTTLGTASSTWSVSLGVVPSGQIQLVDTPATPATPNVMLGAGLLKQPLVMGDNLVTLLTNIWNLLLTHTHPTGVGPSGPSVELNAASPATILPVLNAPAGAPIALKSMYTVTS
jgi:hypothetical protein